MGNAKAKRSFKKKNDVLPVIPFEEAKPLPSLEQIAEMFDALNDYVIVIPIEIKASELIEESDHWKQSPNWARIVTFGDAAGKIIEGTFFPLKAKAGDIVYITRYGEDINLAGVKCQLVHGTEVKVHRKKL